MKNSPSYFAFGEWKYLSEWAKDPRCCVSLRTLYRRMKKYNIPLEEAMTTKGGYDFTEVITAWGEEKTVREWSKDPRCKVSHVLLTRRIRLQWEPEEALSKPARSMREKEKEKIAREKSPILQAWGEKKTARQWIEDERCPHGSVYLIWQRMHSGLSTEDAISLPRNSYNRRLKEVFRFMMIKAFGEEKTVEAWAEDERCPHKDVATIRNRIKNLGHSPEDAISRPKGIRSTKAEVEQNRVRMAIEKGLPPPPISKPKQEAKPKEAKTKLSKADVALEEIDAILTKLSLEERMIPFSIILKIVDPKTKNVGSLVWNHSRPKTGAALLEIMLDNLLEEISEKLNISEEVLTEKNFKNVKQLLKKFYKKDERPN